MDGGIRMFSVFALAVMALSNFTPLPGIRHDLDPVLAVVVIGAITAVVVEVSWILLTRGLKR